MQRVNKKAAGEEGMPNAIRLRSTSWSKVTTSPRCRSYSAQRKFPRR